MNYQHLIKIFYKNYSEYEKTYHERFFAPTTKHFDFSIKQFNRNKEFPAFLCYTEDFALLSEQIYKKYEKFSAMINQVPPIILEQFKLSCIIDEVKFSNFIEGIHSSRRDISEVLQGSSDTSRLSTIVKNHQALPSHKIFKFKTCADIRNFYDTFLQNEIAADNPNNKLDGKIFRKDSVDVTSSTGKTLHRGSYPEDKIIENMNTALQILNDEDIPFLVRVSVFHYFFGYIHPFYDGNGRTVRFITAYFLAEHFHFLPALRLSLTINRQRKNYYDLFAETDSEINRGDLTPFVLGFSQIISDTFDTIEFDLNRKTELFFKYHEKLQTFLPKDELLQEIYQILLQGALFFPYGISMEDLMKWSGKSRNTIKTRLKSAPTDDIITMTVGKKIFYKLNMRIFLR